MTRQGPELDPLAPVRNRMLGEVRAALRQARAVMRGLGGRDLAQQAELDRLAARTDLLFDELEALGATVSSDPDQTAPDHSSSSSSSSSGSSVA